MEFEATQIYEDDELLPTQKISCTEEDEQIQVGTLNINSNEYQIKGGITKIGRHNTCDIVINNVTVSKIHAEIEAMRNQESSIWICDLNSSNKTKLGDKILLPNRLYEVRDGSIITFGTVDATYRAYPPMVIPETPAPSQRRVTNRIIPSTPDSSLNNSSSDGSVILGTQKDKQNNVFLRPQVPQQRQSSIGKKNTSHASSSESDDLQTVTELRASNIDISENRELSSIFDIETQKLEHEMVTSKSIHDIETQIIPMDTSTHFQANTKANKQTKLNVQDEIANTSAIDIHDMETQHYESYINESKTQKSKDNIWNVTLNRFVTDIHVETQNYIDDTNKDTKKSKIDKNNQKKNLDQIDNINDLETQKFNDKNIAEDISNVETQPELNATRKILHVKRQLETDDIVNDINNDRTTKDTDKDNTSKTVNRTNDDKEKDKDNMIETVKTKINYDNVAPSSNSRSSSPGSLNLSSPGVDEDCLSLTQHSDHLLESSDLLEYFGEGIDKRETIRVPNTSTPKSHAKTSSERDNNVENVSNHDEDNIFDALTQRVHEFEERPNEINEKDIICKKKHGSRENIDGDLEKDTEEHSEKFVQKQCKSLEISDKSSNDNISNRNDPGTSVESEDLFDALTQQSNSPAVKNTLNSSVNQLSKINVDVDDMAPTQIINNNKNTHNQDNLINKSLTNINDSNNPIEDGRKKHAGCKKSGESFQEIDSVEQKLHEMFDNVNNSIHEPTHMSTQALEDILESSQYDNNLSANTVNESSLKDSILQTQLEKKNRGACDQSQRKLADTETNNVNNAEIDSQNSDTYFSTLTTKRKRNILKETQELVDSMLQNVIPSHQDSNTSLISKRNNEKIKDNTSTESNKRRKKISKSRNESDSMTDALNDDNVIETISNGNNEKNLRRSMKRKHASASKTDKRVLRNNPNKVKVDDVEKDSGSESDVCAPCPLADVRRTQTSDMNESDDDILARLPPARISGTLSNPASPSATSTLTECSGRSKQDIVKDGNKKIVQNKLLYKQDVEDSKKDKSLNEIHDKPSVSLFDNDVPNCDVPETNKVTTQFVDTSEDSDSEANYKRFKQMADRLNNELDCLKHDKQNKSNKKKSLLRLSLNLSKDLKQDTDDELKSLQISSRVTRQSSKQNDESLNVSCKEAHMENTTYDKSMKPETRSIVTRRKRTLSTIEKDAEQTNLRKHEAHQIIEERPILTRARRNMMKTAIDRQSPNILDYFPKTSSRENSPVIGKSFQDNKTVPETAESSKALNLEINKSVDLQTNKSVDSGRSNIKLRRTAKKSSNSSQQVQAQEEIKSNTTQTKLYLSQHKSILKIVLSPIRSPTIRSPIEDESQEVEMIMRKSLNNVQDKNLSIRETNTAKIFQRKLRIRNKKQLIADTETDSALTESNTSSIDDSNNTQSDNSTSKVKSRKRFTKSSAAKTQTLEKKETFKKPTHINQNSANSVFDSSSENITSESSQNSIESDSLSSSRSSRSKTAGARRKEKVEITRNMRRTANNSVSSMMNTSIEVTSLLSTPSTRMRRSASVLNSTLSVAGHRILFTGITEDYSKIVKTLGGNKVEDPAKCNVLVTDKVRRTYKFLCALAKGIPIVTIDWLRDSESAGQFLDWEDMIMSCGGKALLRPPSKWPEKAMIMSREEDLSSARKFLAKAPKTVTIQSTEFILTGILRQEVDFDKYKIM
ncbi:Mediator of DNA damage checkpoint protein 1 [Camponotus floridanus]|uniref:Mediator of DNA damage checkpoint protein 1 n=1 Tax=Camponotus floridanus TaxID=104421 RepID=E2A4N4_CAMFO|nr:Mediator of DNA damage checkpoint protein 1 [Camponotus floridanus]